MLELCSSTRAHYFAQSLGNAEAVAVVAKVRLVILVILAVLVATVNFH